MHDHDDHEHDHETDPRLIGETPEPPRDELQAQLVAVHGAWQDAGPTLARLQAAEVRTFAFLYAAAQRRTELEAESRPPHTSREQTFRLNLRALAADFAVSRRLTEASVLRKIDDAYTVCTKFPYWYEALEAGEIFAEQLRPLVQHHGALPEERLDEYGRTLFDYAKTHTVPQTHRKAEQLAAKLTRDEFERAHEREFARRHVTVQPGEHGMAWLTAYLPAGQAAAIDDLMRQQAKALRADHLAEARERRDDPDFEADPRTVDQITADVFVETLLTATPESILNSPSEGARRVRASVQVVVPILQLLDPGLATACRNSNAFQRGDVAMLNGLSPMSAREAREFAADAQLQRILTHPISGHVITADIYEPPASLRRMIRARDMTCVFPGCSRPARICELDHTEPRAAGGKTDPDNLGPLCKRHHLGKHATPWRLRNLGGGRFAWISPFGQVIEMVPGPPGPRFVGRDDPPPF
ncbi:HNH endonuclease signature motif containing protein [Gulosibacter faecalis]|uniref:DUF222 domain-containing protein n=1 Tax=Gulosibacter faecalis TaxID=272240 RepID=A0ABW5UZC8_9MICO|nr:HNH endonuclease signature motif containing protein [Gulosibacter faecalis]